ncbi:hypothetical protein BGX20_009628 [Mortierella sp. AD010]|nr:hypothetical protein BGX20_009628 [Mortierella sp. AD010]
MYASPSCELIFNFDPDSLLGKPLLLFIRADDLASFVEQSDAARTSTTIRHLRFWFQSPACREEIPCEALIYGASEAMILVLRKCLPFRRRRLITGANAVPAKAAHNSLYVGKYSTSGQSYSSHSSSYERKATYGRHQTSHGIRGDISESMSSSPAYSSSSNIASSSDSSYRSTSSSISTHQQYPQSTRDHQARQRNMAVGSIQNILNHDKDPSRLRPLTELVRGDSEEASASMVQMKQIHTLDAEEEVEAEIVAGIEKMNLRSSYRRDIGEYERDGYHDRDGYYEDDYDDYRGGTVVSEEIEEFEMPPSMRRSARY